MADQKLPNASSVEHRDGRPVYGTPEKLKRIAAERGLAGLASDTRWNELLALMRGRQGWRPSYRTKLITSDYISGWDVEWQHHLPFPMVSIEWLDVATREEKRIARLPVRVEVTDHTPWMSEAFARIGFDIMVGERMIRIFGYSPRDLTRFDEVETELSR